MNKFLLPKIRFKGFNGEWVLKQIKALGNIKTGKTPSTKNEKKLIKWCSLDYYSRYDKKIFNKFQKENFFNGK